MDPDPTPNPTPFFRDFKDAKKKFFVFFSSNLSAGTLSSVLKIYFFAKNFFGKHYFRPLNTFMRKEKDPDPKTCQIPNTARCA
jgi:hypothetical protein